MAEERLADLLARLEREYQTAHVKYNDALTALDQAVQAMPHLPAAPALHDDSQLATLNHSWDVLPGGPTGLGSPVKGRLRRFVWHIVGPMVAAQTRFNSTVVEHLNRNAKVHNEARAATSAALDALRTHIGELLRFQTRLIEFLQTITPYVDTRDRSVEGQAKVVGAGLSVVSDDVRKRWESLSAREQRFMARVASLDDVRTTAALAQQTALTLKREVERLLAAAATGRDDGPASGSPVSQPDLDAFKYLGFENAFRGSEDEIRRRLAADVPRFVGLGDVIDIGCGRGEFLALLAEKGIGARGVDLNHEMVETARSRGLDVAQADALSFLQGLDDASIGGVFGAQVAEHLEPGYLMRLLEVAQHKLRPGGLILLETINPACWTAYFESYLRDLTHVRALHPETLQFLMRASGFNSVEIDYRSPVPSSARLMTLASLEGDDHLVSLVDAFNENVEKLNARLFSHQDYAAIGRK